MRAALRGKHIEDIAPLLAEAGLEIVDAAPDVVIAHGGDGTLLGAEQEFPGVPKLPIRDARTAPFCQRHTYQGILNAFLRGLSPPARLVKLQADFAGAAAPAAAMNDVFVHNANPACAIRFRVWIDGRPHTSYDIVGDGVGVATPHGSSGYYRSITRSLFKIGIGVAFSHSIIPVDHLVIPDDSVVRVMVTRGPAVAVWDNSHDRVLLDDGGELSIRKAEGCAIVHGLGEFMCPDCARLRHMRRSFDDSGQGHY